jgi:hypothetical protein
MQPTLNVFVVPNAGDCALTRAAVSRSLDRRGFDLLGVFRCEREQLASPRLEPVHTPAELPRGLYDVFITVDLNPLALEARDQVPGLDNGRLRYLGAAVLDAESWIVAKSGAAGIGGFLRVWYTPNTGEGWKVVRQLTGVEQTVKLEIAERTRAMSHPFPVVRPLTGQGISARTDLVEFAGRTAVCKVFRPGRERHLANEVAAGELASTLDAVLPILDRGKNWVVIPFLGEYTSARELCRWVSVRGPRLIPWRAARSFIDGVVELHEAGIAHLDLHSDHVMIGPRGDVKIIDFEKLHRVDKDLPLAESPMIAGYRFTDDFDGVCGGPGLQPFDTRFKPLLGAEMAVFLSGSAAEQITRRSLFRGRRFAGRVSNLARRSVGHATGRR